MGFILNRIRSKNEKPPTATRSNTFIRYLIFSIVAHVARSGKPPQRGTEIPELSSQLFTKSVELHCDNPESEHEVRAPICASRNCQALQTITIVCKEE
jgi:hypothetical protein